MEQMGRIGIFHPRTDEPAVKIWRFSDLDYVSFGSDRWADRTLAASLERDLPLNTIAISSDRFGPLPNFEELLG